MHQNNRVLLASGQRLTTVESALRDAFIGMTSELRSVPDPVRSLLYDLRRADPRRPHLMGAYPKLAFTCAHFGASYANVARPLREIDQALKAFCYNAPLPGLAEIQYRETVANKRLDIAQLRLAETIHRHIVEEARTAAMLQRDETDTLLMVLDGIYHAPSIGLLT